MQHGRDTHCFADFPQTAPDFFQSGFTQQQSEFGTGNRTAARFDNQNIFFQKFLCDISMQIVMAAARIVTSDNRRDTANAT